MAPYSNLGVSLGPPSLALGSYTIMVAKFIPMTGVPLLDFFREDHYFCYLLPLTFVPTFALLYFNWITLELYKHAEGVDG